MYIYLSTCGDALALLSDSLLIAATKCLSVPWSLDSVGPLAIDDNAFTLLFKAKVGALFPVVILFMLAFSDLAEGYLTEPEEDNK